MEEGLYFRIAPLCGENAAYQQEAGRLSFVKNARVTFDTYFNCFSYSKYKKYTVIKQVQAVLRLKGAFTIRLIAYRNGDIPQTICTKTVDYPALQTAVLQFSMDQLQGDGFAYVELTAHSDAADFYGGHFACAGDALNDVKLAVTICTFHKEAFVYRNAHSLGEYLQKPENAELSGNIAMLIVDNGQTLDLTKIQCPKVRLFYNRNLGGSGGFARGLIEAARSAEGFTHVCLMDDDIRFDPEVLYKTYAFLSVLKPQYAKLCIGGTMLELERPYFQYEMGGIWTGRTILNLRCGYDARTVLAVLENELPQKLDYNAWWYMCMPVSVVEDYGLPMPLFIKGDDMDYGMRIASDIVLMNGIAVWHESFDSKYNGALEYYIKRNELILNAVHRPKYGVFAGLIKLLTSCGKQIVFQRYNVVDFILQAYDDFLKGVDFFYKADGEALNKQLMAQNTPMLDCDSLAEKLAKDYPGIVFTRKPLKKPHRIWRIISLYSYLIPKSLYKKAERYRCIDTTDMHPVDFYKATHVVQYNSSSRKGFVSTLQKGQAARFLFRFIRISIKMLLRYHKTACEFRKRQHELTSKEFWFAQLELSENPKSYLE